MTELDFIELFRDINKIKHKEREGWKKNGVDRPRDTIASHSYSSAIIGWILAEKNDQDSDRIVKMLLIHDLIMAYIPDYTPEDEEFNSKKELEMQEAENMIEKVPEEIEKEFEDLFKEFQEKETDLAQLAKESDKIETLLQSKMYSEELGTDITEEFLHSYRDIFETELGKQIFEEIKKLSED